MELGNDFEVKAERWCAQNQMVPGQVIRPNSSTNF